MSGLEQQNAAHSVRHEELDCLRGIAALCVMIYHYTYYFDELYGHAISIPRWLDFGKHGVNLFFIVSGFVIFMTLSRTRAPMSFVVSRFSRLYPAYWCAVVFTFMVVSLNGLPNLETTPLQAAINLTMLQRFLRIPSVDNSYWTLSYELLFYLAIFIAFLTGALRRPTLVCAFFMTYQLTIITAYRYGVHFPEAFVKSTGVPYGHQFATGIAFYCLATGEQRRLSPHVIILAAIAIDLILPDDLSGPVENNGYVFAVFCALFYLFVFGRLRFIINRPLVYLGAISYSLYLVHQHFGFVVIRACKELGFHTIPAVCSAMIASFLVAIAIHHIVEVPVMHSIRKWYRVRWDLLGILRTT